MAINKSETLSAKPKKTHKFKQFLKTKKDKAITVAGAVMIIVAALLAVPVTRYTILGQVIHKNIHITVIDSETKKPVVDARIKVGSNEGVTDKEGKTSITGVSVGEYSLVITKKYYADYSQTYVVPVVSAPQDVAANIKATGRQVEVVVSDRVSGESIQGATIAASDTTAATNERGLATIVLPADKSKQTAVISKDGYNQKTATITTSIDGKPNKISLTRAGKITYLSKATGKINVMQANLDGSSPKVLFAGTGQEKDNGTILFSARDWKYSALLSQREGTEDKVYLINNTTGKIDVIDQGKASFALAGWSGHNFVYKVNRDDKTSWDKQGQAVKLFNADTNQLKVVDETTATGSNDYNYQREFINSVFILDSEIVYAKIWSYGGDWQYRVSNKNTVIVSIDPSTGQKKTVHTFPQPARSSIDTRLYEPQGVYIRVTTNGDYNNPRFYEYEDGAVRSVTDTNDNKFYGFYPTYLISPGGEKSFWYEPRDGKNTIFVGDKFGKNSKQLASSSEYVPYGWYGKSDEYVLLAKNNSELYIASARLLGTAGYAPIKVTDYHKPQGNSVGYGYGYGGF